MAREEIRRPGCSWKVEITVADIRKDSPVLVELEANGTIKITGAMYNLSDPIARRYQR